MNLKEVFKKTKLIFTLLSLFVFFQKSQAQDLLEMNQMNKISLIKKDKSDSLAFVRYKPEDFFYKNITDTMVGANSFRYTVIDSFIIGLRFDSFECCKYALGFLINKISGTFFVFAPHPYIDENYSGQTYFLNANKVSYYSKEEDVLFNASIGLYWLPVKKIFDFKNGYKYTFYRNDKKEFSAIKLYPKGESVVELNNKLLLYFKNIREYQLKILKEKNKFRKEEHSIRIYIMSPMEIKETKQIGIYSADWW